MVGGLITLILGRTKEIMRSVEFEVTVERFIDMRLRRNWVSPKFFALKRGP